MKRQLKRETPKNYSFLDLVAPSYNRLRITPKFVEGGIFDNASNNVNPVEPDDEWIKKLLNYEYTKGSSSGGNLPNYGYNNWQMLGHSAPPSGLDEAVSYFKKDFLPGLLQYPMGMRERIGDFTYNTGRDYRTYMLDQYLKSMGQTGLPNRSSYNVDTKSSQWTPELQKSLDEQWNTYKDQINALPLDQQVNLLDKGRDFYYQNINQVNGQPNPSYNATWKGRLSLYDPVVSQPTQNIVQQPVVQTPVVPKEGAPSNMMRVPNYLENEILDNPISNTNTNTSNNSFISPLNPNYVAPKSNGFSMTNPYTQPFTSPLEGLQKIQEQARLNEPVLDESSLGPDFIPDDIINNNYGYTGSTLKLNDPIQNTGIANLPKQNQWDNLVEPLPVERPSEYADPQQAIIGSIKTDFKPADKKTDSKYMPYNINPFTTGLNLLNAGLNTVGGMRNMGRINKQENLNSFITQQPEAVYPNKRMLYGDKSMFAEYGGEYSNGGMYPDGGSVYDPDAYVGELVEYKKGGIYIKPENKGKFTAWAQSHGMSVQEAASHVMANKEKYSSTTVKRANFAKNASKWKHADGGPITEGEKKNDRPVRYFDKNDIAYKEWLAREELSKLYNLDNVQKEWEKAMEAEGYFKTFPGASIPMLKDKLNWENPSSGPKKFESVYSEEGIGEGNNFRNYLLLNSTPYADEFDPMGNLRRAYDILDAHEHTSWVDNWEKGKSYFTLNDGKENWFDLKYKDTELKPDSIWHIEKGNARSKEDEPDWMEYAQLPIVHRADFEAMLNPDKVFTKIPTPLNPNYKDPTHTTVPFIKQEQKTIPGQQVKWFSLGNTTNVDPAGKDKILIDNKFLTRDEFEQYKKDNPNFKYSQKPDSIGRKYEKGGYVVTRSNDRKGKTHKVTGPDGTVKYFGDSKMGQHPGDPDRKAAFYARHKSNLKNNPHFRAFARKTWEKGGEIDNDKEMVEGVADILSRVNDIENRKELANYMVNQFDDENVDYDYDQFLNATNLIEMAYGGMYPYGGSTLPPIFTSNRNDPRLRSYNDSLNLSNRFPMPRNRSTFTPYVRETTAYFPTGTTRSGVPVMERRPNINLAIEPIGYTRSNNLSNRSYNRTEGRYENPIETTRPVYKKPVQPIIYREEPKVFTDIPTPLNPNYKPKETFMTKSYLDMVNNTLPEEPIVELDPVEITASKTPYTFYLGDSVYKTMDPKKAKQFSEYLGVKLDNDGNAYTYDKTSGKGRTWVTGADGKLYPSLKDYNSGEYKNAYDPSKVFGMTRMEYGGMYSYGGHYIPQDVSYIGGRFVPNRVDLQEFKKGGMIKRADGSYSQRGLWDNIRANKGSGKKPTKEMLKQERKIKKGYKAGGEYMEGNEYEISGEELERLRSLGYDIELI